MGYHKFERENEVNWSVIALVIGLGILAFAVMPVNAYSLGGNEFPYRINVTLTAARFDELIQYNFTFNQTNCGNTNCSDIRVALPNGQFVQHQVIYNNRTQGADVSRSRDASTWILFITNGQNLTYTIYFGNNSIGDNSSTILAWEDDFEKYSVGAIPTRWNSPDAFTGACSTTSNSTIASRGGKSWFEAGGTSACVSYNISHDAITVAVVANVTVAGGGGGIMIRSDDNNFYDNRFANAAFNMTIFERGPGTLATGQPPRSTSLPYNMSFRANSSTLRGYFEGQQDVIINSSTFATGSRIGLTMQTVNGMAYDYVAIFNLSVYVGADNTTNNISATGLENSTVVSANNQPSRPIISAISKACLSGCIGINYGNNSATFNISATVTNSSQNGTIANGGVIVEVGVTYNITMKNNSASNFYFEVPLNASYLSTNLTFTLRANTTANATLFNNVSADVYIVHDTTAPTITTIRNTTSPCILPCSTLVNSSASDTYLNSTINITLVRPDGVVNTSFILTSGVNITLNASYYNGVWTIRTFAQDLAGTGVSSDTLWQVIDTAYLPTGPTTSAITRTCVSGCINAVYGNNSATINVSATVLNSTMNGTVNRVIFEYGGFNFTASNTSQSIFWFLFTLNTSFPEGNTTILRIRANTTTNSTLFLNTSADSAIVHDTIYPEPRIIRHSTMEGVLLGNAITINVNTTDVNPLNWTLLIIYPNGTLANTSYGSGNVSFVWNTSSTDPTGNWTLNLTATDLAGNSNRSQSWFGTASVTTSNEFAWEGGNFTNTTLSWGASTSLTNGSVTDFDYIRIVQFAWNGICTNCSTTVQFNISTNFTAGSYQIIQALENLNASVNFTVTGSNLINWTSELVNITSTMNNLGRLRVRIPSAWEFARSPLVDCAGSNFCPGNTGDGYILYRILARNVSQAVHITNSFVTATLATGQIFDNLVNHLRYNLCTVGNGTQYNCTSSGSNVDIDDSNNANNQPLLINVYGPASALNTIRFRVNMSDLLFRVTITSPAMTGGGGGGTGGGGGGGTGLVSTEGNVTWEQIPKTMQRFYSQGTRSTESIVLINRNNLTLTLTATITSGDFAKSAAPWVKFIGNGTFVSPSQEVIEIPGNSQRTITFDIDVPASATVGDYGLEITTNRQGGFVTSTTRIEIGVGKFSILGFFLAPVVTFPNTFFGLQAIQVWMVLVVIIGIFAAGGGTWVWKQALK